MTVFDDTPADLTRGSFETPRAFHRRSCQDARTVACSSGLFRNGIERHLDPWPDPRMLRCSYRIFDQVEAQRALCKLRVPV